MATANNHSRPITLGDVFKNIPTSANVDTFDRILLLQFGLRFIDQISDCLSFSTKIKSIVGKRKFIGKRLSKRIIEDLHSLPKTLKIIKVALEDSIYRLHRSAECESIAPALKPVFLEKDEPKTHN